MTRLLYSAGRWPSVHEALQVLLEQRLAPGSGGLPMRPPRRESVRPSGQLSSSSKMRGSYAVFCFLWGKPNT
ncbi:hypothetical protein TYRP_023745 [Tyrophagus putrescentiae]|nr:hypothetical protein TYRP_023745 [Tyrophagus putrescentiae]